MEEVRIKSLGKALSVLECFIDSPVLGVTEVSEKMGIYKSNASDIFSTFRAHGFVVQDAETGKYRLGYRILELSHSLTTMMGYRQTIYPYIKELADKLGETVYYGVPEGSMVLYLDAAYPSHEYSTRAMLGDRAELYCTGIGKAILSFTEESRWQEMIPEKLKAYTESTITDREALYAQLRRFHAQGYSVDNMEHEYGIKCVGVPLLNSSGNAVGGVSVSGPSLRFDDAHIGIFAKALQETVRQMRVYL